MHGTFYISAYSIPLWGAFHQAVFIKPSSVSTTINIFHPIAILHIYGTDGHSVSTIFIATTWCTARGPTDQIPSMQRAQARREKSKAGPSLKFGQEVKLKCLFVTSNNSRKFVLLQQGCNMGWRILKPVALEMRGWVEVCKINTEMMMRNEVEWGMNKRWKNPVENEVMDDRWWRW